ncbi:MAG: DUF4367 domain-containing protein [Clostridiales Family XIII bacterium]|jgi:hypothetical protein|nr:DUF4367 domain-containing protein [Clostridiales Family XIII bacterium]
MNPNIAHKKSEAILSLMAAKLVEKLENEYDRIEKAEAEEELPLYVDAGFQKVFASFVADEKRSKRRQTQKSILKVAVIALVFLSLSLTVLVVSVDAFKYKAFDWLFSQEDGYNQFIPYELMEEESRMQDWHGYYFPEYVPAGYRPAESYKTDGHIFNIRFVDENQNFIGFQQSPLASSGFLVDNEGSESGQSDIDGETGFWNLHDDTLTLLWMRGETGFLITSNALSVEEAEKIAKSLAYRK